MHLKPVPLIRTPMETIRVTQLQKRIKRGDDETFAELLGIWEEKGTLK